MSDLIWSEIWTGFPGLSAGQERYRDPDGDFWVTVVEEYRNNHNISATSWSWYWNLPPPLLWRTCHQRGHRPPLSSRLVDSSLSLWTRAGGSWKTSILSYSCPRPYIKHSYHLWSCWNGFVFFFIKKIFLLYWFYWYWHTRSGYNKSLLYIHKQYQASQDDPQ